MSKSQAVLFLIFNRLDTASRVFEAIREAQPSRLYIAADGPRPHKMGELEACLAVRNLATQVDWPCEVYTLFRNENLGCAKAVKGAIDWFFEHEDEGIILEDDCLPRPEFFLFCSAMLDRWRNNEEIMMISGTNHLFGKVSLPYDYYFSHFSAIWGWATWKRAWQQFDISISKEHTLKKSSYLMGYIREKRMAEWLSMMFITSQDTWACTWFMTMIKNKKMSISPVCNLVTNIGIEGSHTNKDIGFTNMPTQHLDTSALRHPNKIIWNREIDFITFKTICDTHFTLKDRLIFKIRCILEQLHLLSFIKRIKNIIK